MAKVVTSEGKTGDNAAIAVAHWLGLHRVQRALQLVQELEVAAAAIEYGDAEPDMRLAIDVLVNRPVNGIEEVKQKLATLLATHPWMARDEVTETVGRIASGNASARSKRRKVIAIADSVMAALAPHVARPPGCSQCCHMNTVTYEHEAERLAEATGRKMVRLPFRPPRVVHAEGMKFNGTPRPFLMENRCSEYEDRPLACRTHHSLRDAVEACSMDLPAAEPVRPPMYDPDLLEGPYQAISLRHRPTEPCGNIGNSLQSDARLRSIVGLRAGGGITASDFHALPHFGIGGGAGGLE